MTTMLRLELWHMVAAAVVWAGFFVLVVRGCLRDAAAADAQEQERETSTTGMSR